MPPDRVPGLLFTFTCGDGRMCDVFIPGAIGAIKRKSQEGPILGPPEGAILFYSEPEGEEPTCPPL